MDRKQGRIFFILAGIGSSQSNIDRITNRIQQSLASPSVRVDVSGFPHMYQDGSAAYDMKSAEQFLHGFYSKHIKGKSEEILPKQIYLIYVDIKSWQELLNIFSHFVFPIRVGYANAHESVAKRICSKSDANVRDMVESIKSVVERDGHPKRRYLMLPPENFSSIKMLFDQLFNEGSTIKSVDTKALDLEDSPNISNNRSVRVYYRDNRNLIFKRCSIDQQHGEDSRLFTTDERGNSHRPFSVNDTDHDTSGIKRVMNGCYRFGVRYNPGFHFDVEIPENPGNTTLYCSKGKENCQPCTRDINRKCCYHHNTCEGNSCRPKQKRHTNVYPNDFVRWTSGS